MYGHVGWGCFWFVGGLVPSSMLTSKDQGYMKVLTPFVSLQSMFCPKSLCINLIVDNLFLKNLCSMHASIWWAVVHYLVFKIKVRSEPKFFSGRAPIGVEEISKRHELFEGLLGNLVKFHTSNDCIHRIPEESITLNEIETRKKKSGNSSMKSYQGCLTFSWSNGHNIIIV